MKVTIQTKLVSYVHHPNKSTVQWETLINPHFNSFDEINFDKLLEITIVKALIWDIY